MNDAELETYLADGVRGTVRNIIDVTNGNLKTSLYMSRFAYAARKAERRRQSFEKQGRHIPAFLIASIAAQCNLHCAGCYAYENDICLEDGDQRLSSQLDADRWGDLFSQATDMGVSFILLAGGEPFMRPDVLHVAGDRKDILFPIFTNGTMFDDTTLDFLESHRNLIPVISMEGGRASTDGRRGQGLYDRALSSMGKLDNRGIPFGVSVTLNRGNMDETLDERFIDDLTALGCKAVVYVEYVPFAHAIDIALDDRERNLAVERLDALRRSHDDLLLLSFPGDEAVAGGCLAAGRGFFHINPFGGAEPCPFSPYSDTDLHDHTLLEALDSPLFVTLADSGVLQAEHTGGCTLFEQEAVVKGLIRS